MIEARRKYYYQKDKSNLKINTLLAKNEYESICDTKTYQKVRKGGIIKNDDVYDQLLNKLSVKALNDPKLDEQIKKLEEQMLKAFSELDHTELCKQARMLSELCEAYKSYIYYEELAIIAHKIELYFSIYNYFKTDSFEYFYNALLCFDDELKPLI